MDKPEHDAEPVGTASLAVLEQQARSPMGRLAVWLSTVTLALGLGVGGWLLLQAFEAARHRPPSGPLDLFNWIIGA